jgi:hypothetical protein
LQEDIHPSSIPQIETSGEVTQFPNIYATHNVRTEARLDMAGIQAYPSEPVSQSLLPGEAVTFTWRIKSERTGISRGTVWAYLDFLPRDGGADIQLPIYSQVIEIPVISLFGLSGPSARIIGIIGILISFLLVFDSLLAWSWRRISIHSDS